MARIQDIIMFLGCFCYDFMQKWINWKGEDQLKGEKKLFFLVICSPLVNYSQFPKEMLR